MTLRALIVTGCLAVYSATAAFPAEKPVRTITPFDATWRFFRGDATDAQQPAFADNAWQTVDVPHDWSIEGPFDEKAPTRGDGGFLPSGVSWYRKAFTIPASQSGRHAFIEFDGVMANSEVWINGHSLGKRPFGYVSFRYDLTPYLKTGDGQTNVLAVRTDTSGQPASRWYTGAGIYRHVRLIVTDPVRLDHWSAFVTTPAVADAKATVSMRVTAVNGSAAARTVSLRVQLLDPDGRSVGTAETASLAIAAGASVDLAQEVVVSKPRRWDLASPVLYRAIAELREKGKTLDDDVVPFGIREFRFEPATGFWLNGRNFKIKGVCLHHDGGAFGAAVPLRVWERRLEILRTLGVNAIRTAHNPVSPEFLDLCDRMGFLVMNEFLDAWTVAKRAHDYHRHFEQWALIDTRDTIRRDRNHPSVILYSAGNEIHDTPKPDLAKKVLASLIEVYHREDPTRPVTQALFRPNRSGDYTNGLADMLDVVGQNYREREILAAYTQKPTRKIIGTENGHQSSVWVPLRDNPPYAGQFIWSGIDYLGESRRWPLIATDFGVIDRAAGFRPRSYERMSWWSDQPVVHIVRRMGERPPPVVLDPGYENAQQVRQQIQQQREPALRSDWNPSVATPHEETVEVFSNCEEIELVLNGRSLGAQPLPENASPRMWKVPFEAGTIRAIGKNGGKVVASHELRTAGAPAKLVVTADRKRVANHWDDVVTVEIHVVDEHGTRVPSASHPLTFSIAGPGVVAAVDNADNASHEPFRGLQRSAHDGRCYAFVKATASTGRIEFSVTSPGLAGATLPLDAVP